MPPILNRIFTIGGILLFIFVVLMYVSPLLYKGAYDAGWEAAEKFYMRNSLPSKKKPPKTSEEKIDIRC